MKNIFNFLLVMGLASFVFISCTETKSEQPADEHEKEAEATFTLTNVPNVTNGAEAYFSPDGKSLIFNGKLGEDTTHQVYTINIDGTDLKQINGIGDDACSHYTPDGKSLLWTSTRDNLDMHRGNYSDPQDYPQGAELYQSDLDGNNIVRLTDNEQYDAEVGISPDGKTILFGRQTDGMMDLWTMDTDGSNQKQITFTPDWQEGGAFIMPDNKTVLYRAWKKSEEGQKSKDMHLFIVDVNGENMKQLTHEAGTHWAPFPAPDGEHFAYVKVFPPHNYEIVMRSIKTGEEKRLTNSPSFDGFPAISPDGKTLSFSSSRGNEKGNRALKLWLMDISSLNLGAKE
ncbi:MAG: hypothetical protein ABFS32_00090 [Bacteroidota bacterium]